MTTCRRCSECRGDVHHWIESVYGEEMIDENSPSHICKHCDATGDECDTCDGAGELSAVPGCGGQPFTCNACGGYSIVVRPTQRTGEGSKP